MPFLQRVSTCIGVCTVLFSIVTCAVAAPPTKPVKPSISVVRRSVGKPAAIGKEKPVYLHVPANREYARVVPGGITILPNGRFVTPKGRRIYTGEDLWNIAVRVDEKVLVGFSDGAITIYALPDAKVPQVLRTKGLNPVGVFTKDGKRLIVSNGDNGGWDIYDTTGWDTPQTAPTGSRFVLSEQKPVQTISANTNGVADSYINDFVLSADEHFAYGADIANERIVTVDLQNGSVVASVKAGREPYAVALSSDNRLCVANIGIFDYSLVPAPTDDKGSKRGLTRPPFGFPSREAANGVDFEGRFVPGLGSPYLPDAQSVWQYDVADPTKPTVLKKAKSGLLIHAPADNGKAVGGSAPNKLLVYENYLLVSNANSDTLQVFDARTLNTIRTVKLSPSPLVAKLRGVIPSGMVVDTVTKRLYLAESGINAVAVLDLDRLITKTENPVIGHIPTGWFPIQLALSDDLKTLYIGTQKGIGRGPRGPKNVRASSDERYGLTDMPGMIQAVTLGDDASLKSGTADILRNNGIVDRTIEVKTLPKSPLARVAGSPSENIKYVVFITKENHTFDGIFGGLKGAKGEPDYAEFGREGWARERGKAERIPIMPNHINLAERFAINDNFYMEPQASGDGHRWLVGVYPSLWTTRLFYTGWHFDGRSKAKGRLVPFGSNGSQIPEDYLENGSLWEHLNGGGITFRNYGEGFEFAGDDEDATTSRSGAYLPINFPMPKILFDNTDFDFPAYNNFIPDIARADWFIEDLEKYRKTHNGKIPQFLNIAICNDHGTTPRPKDGYPYVCSFMADNDLALGRIVAYLSKTPEWKKMAIFVTQDDSGGDNDHVDRHRSFVLAISPWAKKGYVSHDHTSIMSIIKSIYLTFGLSPNNMFDGLATDLSDMFTMTPDFTPYKYQPSDRRVFREEETFDPFDPKFEKRRKQTPVAQMDNPKFVEYLRNRPTR